MLDLKTKENKRVLFENWRSAKHEEWWIDPFFNLSLTHTLSLSLSKFQPYYSIGYWPNPYHHSPLDMLPCSFHKSKRRTKSFKWFQKIKISTKSVEKRFKNKLNSTVGLMNSIKNCNKTHELYYKVQQDPWIIAKISWKWR